jgi:TRAP transporter TAXI family solute receptor
MTKWQAWRERLSVGMVGLWLAALIAFVVAFQWVKPPPPRHIVVATGRADGAYYKFAGQYRARFAREGIDLEIRETSGSVENIALLKDPASGVDLAFVQGGTGAAAGTDPLWSLASLYFEPLWVFTPAARAQADLREMRGRRLAVGPEGSGTRAVALRLLAAHGVDGQSADLHPATGGDAIRALRQREVDAVFLIAGPGSPTVMELLGMRDVALLSFPRADAYTKQFPFLTKLVLPAGALSLRTDLPPRDTVLLAPAATLAVRADFHPALVDLVLTVAAAIHGQRGLFEEARQFPSPDHLEFPLMSEARRFHQSGPPFLARYLPFWAATLVDRMKVLLLPLFVFVPLVRLVPEIIEWRVRSKIFSRYRDVVDVDHGLARHPSSTECDALLARLDHIEEDVRALRVPLSYSDAYYNLQVHLELVRRRVQETRQAGAPLAPHGRAEGRDANS